MEKVKTLIINESTKKFSKGTPQKEYRSLKGEDGITYSCFESNVWEEVEKYLGKPIQLGIAESNGYWNVRSFHGLCNESSVNVPVEVVKSNPKPVTIGDNRQNSIIAQTLTKCVAETYIERGEKTPKQLAVEFYQVYRDLYTQLSNDG